MSASPWTRIDTPQGERRVDALRVGDPVWSTRNYDGHLTRVEARVAAIGKLRWDRGTHRVVKVRLENGRVLEVSGTHPTADGRTFDDLRAGDDLGGQIVRSVAVVPFKVEHTHDIRPDTRGGCYWAEGALIGSTLPAEAVADTIPAAPWGSVSAEAGAE